MSNENIILVSGKSTTGKSLSLRNLAPQEGVIYLNYENNKALPFPNKFKSLNVTEPYDTYEAFSQAEDMPEVHTIVLDTITFMMDMFESKHVRTADDTRAAWGNYSQFFKELMQDYVAQSSKRIVMLGHTADVMNDKEMTLETMVKVKGGLMNNGIEAFFTNIVSTKKVPISILENYENELLNITDRERMLGYKHVFQTLQTKETVNERMRSPLFMWDDSETFIDNDITLVLERLNKFYNQ